MVLVCGARFCRTRMHLMHDLEANCLRTVKRPSRESGSPKYPNEKCTIFKMRTYPGPDRYTQVRPRRCTQAHAGTRRGCTSALSHPIPGYPCQLFCLSTVAISIGLSLFFSGLNTSAQDSQSLLPGSPLCCGHADQMWQMLRGDGFDGPWPISFISFLRL